MFPNKNLPTQRKLRIDVVDQLEPVIQLEAQGRLISGNLHDPGFPDGHGAIAGRLRLVPRRSRPNIALLIRWFGQFNYPFVRQFNSIVIDSPLPRNVCIG